MDAKDGQDEQHNDAAHPVYLFYPVHPVKILFMESNAMVFNEN